MAEKAKKPVVGLFATCLVDSLRPSVGFATASLLEQAGCDVCLPSQSCCGQPAYNSGDRQSARAIAKVMIEAFGDVDYVVVPSGSCAGMIVHHYPDLFADDPSWAMKARAVADKTYELSVFLTRIRPLATLTVRFPHKVAYHDSCSCLREMKIFDEPRRLMAQVEGLELVENSARESCCGFGGLFSVKYGEISSKIAETKVKAIVETGADVLLAADLGCLVNIAGKLSREGHSIEVRHLAEVLAGDCSQPAIARPEKNHSD